MAVILGLVLFDLLIFTLRELFDPQKVYELQVLTEVSIVMGAK